MASLCDWNISSMQNLLDSQTTKYVKVPICLAGKSGFTITLPSGKNVTLNSWAVIVAANKNNAIKVFFI